MILQCHCEPEGRSDLTRRVIARSPKATVAISDEIASVASLPRNDRSRRGGLLAMTLGALIFFCFSLSAETHVRASLVTESKAIVPGKPFWAAVRLTMDKGWHTYSEPPGDSGLATRILWDLPAGFSAGPILWPKARKFTEGEITNFIYEGTVDLRVKIRPPKTYAGKMARLKAKVKWLECRDVCLPGSADLSLEIPVKP